MPRNNKRSVYEGIVWATLLYSSELLKQVQQIADGWECWKLSA
jgi:hypothetical protein